MKTVISFLLVFSFSYTFSQTPTYSNVSAPAPQRSPMFLRDAFSTPFEPKPYAGIQGSPYIEDAWILANIKFLGTKQVVDSLGIKINVYENKIHFKNEKGEEMQMSMQAEEIKIIDSASALRNKIFLSGFDQDAGFFEVLTDGGKLKLLKKHKAFIWETKPLGSEPQKNFQLESELFLCNNKTLYKISKNCTVIASAFNNDEKVLNYISANNIRCNKEEDLRKLVIFYASLKE